MDATEIWKFLACERDLDGSVRVRSREKIALEFKQDFDKQCLIKSIKTIAAFANCAGGHIVFGVTDKPRIFIGVKSFLDESDVSQLLMNHLHPVPNFELFDETIEGLRVAIIYIHPIDRPPVMAIKDLQTAERKNSTVLQQGTIYYRRAGQTSPASGAEFSALLDRRDKSVRDSILSVISRSAEVGFDNVAVADFRGSGPRKEDVTLWVPEATAKTLNIVDRGRLVTERGAPAYEIRGAIKIAVANDKDPRKPLLPEQSARVLRRSIEKVFWPGFPWKATHLKLVTKHLGFWADPSGDSVHTNYDKLTGRSMYYEQGRAAVESFAARNPAEFVDVIGSQATKAEWRRRKRELAPPPAPE